MALLKECENIFRGVCYKHGTPNGVHCEHRTCLIKESTMTSLFQDVRYGFRMLLKHKGFSIVAVLTLALGIGVNTAMFSVLNTFLFRSLPYPQSSQLVRVFRTSPHSQSWPHNPGVFFTQRERNTVFEKMAAYNYVSRSLVEQGQTAERVSGLAGTSDFLPLFGVAPALGRLFNPEEFEAGPITSSCSATASGKVVLEAIQVLWVAICKWMERQ